MKEKIKYIKQLFSIHTVEIFCLLLDCGIVAFAAASRRYEYLLLIPSAYLLFIGIEYLLYLTTHKTPLPIKTPDGSDEPYHPSVVFIPEGGWKGYKYWLAFTPMPAGNNPRPYVDRWEIPCVYASNDGINFSDVGNKGFLDDLTDQEIEDHDFFSDPHLVYNEKEDRLELYYRLSSHSPDNKRGDGEVSLLRKTSQNGITWSPRETLMKVSDHAHMGKTVVSPAIILRNEEYDMWYVSSFQSKRTVSSSKSRDGIIWYDTKTVKFQGREVDPWHIDCTEHNGKYWMLIYEFSNELSLWRSEDGITFSFDRIVLKKSAVSGSFYRNGLYRSCMVFDDSCSIYFSARYKSYCCLGLAKSRDMKTFMIQNGGSSWSNKHFINDITDRYFYLLKRILEKVAERGKSNAGDN